MDLASHVSNMGMQQGIALMVSLTHGLLETKEEVATCEEETLEKILWQKEKLNVHTSAL